MYKTYRKHTRTVTADKDTEARKLGDLRLETRKLETTLKTSIQPENNTTKTQHKTRQKTRYIFSS